MHPTLRALNFKKASVFKLLVVITALLSWVIALGAASATMLGNLYSSWHLGRTQTLTLYLPPDADSAALTQLTQSLPALAGVSGVTQVAGTELQAWLQPVIASPESLPLPTVVEIALAPSADRAAISAHIQQAFPTAEIDDHRPLLAQVENAVHTLQFTAAALGAVMLVLMALMVILTVRTGLSAQKSTLHLLITLGATDATLSRHVTHQVSLRTLTGAAVGSVVAAVVLAVATALAPALAAHVGLNTWVMLFAAPLLLPTLAALTAHTATRKLLTRIA